MRVPQADQLPNRSPRQVFFAGSGSRAKGSPGIVRGFCNCRSLVWRTPETGPCVSNTPTPLLGG